MGISNQIFPTERDETPYCQYAMVPNDITNPVDGGISDMERFAFFMRFLAPPAPYLPPPGAGRDSVVRGSSLFTSTGCAACHTPTLYTGNASVAALRNKAVNLFSDLAVHGMGPGLADGVSQGQAAGDEFRTAPLWGLGQRIFFLHDGRSKDLIDVIQAHRSGGNGKYKASEANNVVERFDDLSESKKQDLLNFLRSL